MSLQHAAPLCFIALSLGSILGCGARPSDQGTPDDFAGGWQVVAEPSEPSPVWAPAPDENATASNTPETDPVAVQPTDPSETSISEVKSSEPYPSASQPVDSPSSSTVEAAPSDPTTGQSGETTTVPEEPASSPPTTTAEPSVDPIPSAARFAGVWKTELQDDGSGAGIVAGQHYELILSDTSNSLEQKIDGRLVIHTETTRAGWWALTILEAVVDSMGGGGVDAADAPSIIFLPELAVTGSTAEVVKEGWFGNSTRWSFRIDESDPNLLHAECTWIKGLESLPFRRQ